MIKHCIDYAKSFLRNWEEIKESINCIIVRDLIHRKVVLQTDDLNKTFERMKYIVDYKPTYKRKPDDLKKIFFEYSSFYDFQKTNDFTKQTSEENLNPEVK